MRKELSAFREAVLVGEMQNGTIGTHVRHGDKYYEAKEYAYNDYQRIFEWIAGAHSPKGPQDIVKKCPEARNYLKPFQQFLPTFRDKHLYVGTDDPQVLQEAVGATKGAWSLVYMNVTRLEKRMPLMDLQKKLGPKQTVMESLLNLELLMESDGFVCTWTSNWCRLVDEMRMTVAMKADHLSFEVSKHCPSFNWVHGQGKPTPDFR